MKRRPNALGVFSLALIGWPAAPSAQVPGAVPTARTATDSAIQGAPTGTVERARRGVVVLERGGRPLGLGVVLEGDGRILTALSPLTHGNFINARYHDGSLSPVKLIHSDRAWDLSLLKPEKADKKAGVRAAKSSALQGLSWLSLSAPPNTVTVAPASLKAAPPLLGGDGRALTDAYELGFKAAYVGAPIVNADGDVVALVARACPAGSGAGCLPAPYGVPLAALKQFLRKVPTETTWLGIVAASGESGSVRGVRVVSFAKGSPAAEAGLRAGKDGEAADLIIAVNGSPVVSPSELTDAVRASSGGGSVELLVYGMRRYRQVTVQPLTQPPPEPTAPPRVAPKPGRPRTPNPYR